MTARTKWALAGVTAALAGGIWLAAARWLPNDAKLTDRLQEIAQERLGVPVEIGSAHWSLFPAPVIEVDHFRTRQDEPVTVGRLVAYPRIVPLLQGKLSFARVMIKDAVLPSASVRVFRRAEKKPDQAPPGRFEFRNVTWVSRGDKHLAYDGEVSLDDDWRPHQAELRRAGVKPPFILAVDRDGNSDHWHARIKVGGGTMNGDLELKTVADGTMHLNGTLSPHNVEVADTLRTFDLNPVVSGRGSGRTLVWAEGRRPGDLLHSLHTRTTFRISQATVLRFDLVRAIDTLGKEHDGRTPLDHLTGQLDTQNTGNGIRVVYTDLKARSGRYSATGEATTYHGSVEGRGKLYVDNATEVPFTITGPMKKPRTSVSKPAAAAAIVNKKAGDFADKVAETFGNIFGAEN
jgi:hypothetical protein